MPVNPVKGCDGKFIDDNELNEGWIEHCKPSIGLTKREHFAGLAMQGFAACDGEYAKISDMADAAVSWADALLKELAK